jgi:hypothetical protein
MLQSRLLPLLRRCPDSISIGLIKMNLRDCKLAYDLAVDHPVLVIFAEHVILGYVI